MSTESTETETQKTQPRTPRERMTVGILTREPKNYTCKRLKEALKASGHRVRMLDTTALELRIAEGSPELMYKGKKLQRLDAVIPRIGASLTFFGTSVVRQLEQQGVFCLNTAHGISVSRDKLRSLQVLCRHNVGLPQTAFVQNREAVLSAIDYVGGEPVIIKLLEGTQGIGVMLAETRATAAAVVETLQSTKQNVLVQKFVAESRGRDIRAFVVGDRVVAAMRRVAAGDEFRSNVHRGGAAEAVELDARYTEAALRAARVLGLRVAGVDMLEGKDGPLIMEVNSSPGLQGIEGATGLDVAGAIVQYIEDNARFPGLNYRERLTLARGYLVAELPLPASSPFVGKTIDETGLRAADITVLQLHRGNKVIPNPRTSRVLEAGDTLLCYGLQSSLAERIAPPRRRRR